ncbi:M16 family metallopeptidase [Pedobacter puniceum]|uniref:Insulinase family protein n=1 Tax=Pedobacter puniceum TaxID=2666136 RepID=A0A7K0FQJ8_9SPHI|nr:pitrilysin family protein [Pedobacter puniceum]MRX47550.1 insulinase family protein [Pedobacter puniceum]
MDHEVYRLRNGIRILFKPTVSPIGHCCLIINAGARDEEEGKPGLAHFIEHLLFKGTKKRNTNQILNRLEVVGADLNAYTTKEYTCLHASFLHEHLERSVDLLQDIAFFSMFPEIEMEKEKGVIIDEILSYEDQPEEAINDDFESLLFKGNPLGENILGTKDSVSAFKKSDILNFIARTYNTHEIVFAVSGNYKATKIWALCDKYFGIIPENRKEKQRLKPIPNPKQELIIAKPINQAHCILGSHAYSFHDDKKHGLLLLNNLLGGNGMSSRLNLEIREKYGIAYTIESNYTAFSDSGIFSIYFGTDEEKVNKALKLVHKELKKLREQKLGVVQLQQAKQKFIGQIALGEENRMGVLISMAKSLIDFNRVDSLEEVFAKLNAVSASEILEIANEVFNPNLLNLLMFKPEEEN